MFKAYYHLTKPGIVYGNAITAAAGFVFAGGSSLPQFITMLIGLSGVIAAACVINNVIDSDIDALMTRTKDRAVATGVIGTSAALNFAAVLLGAGLAFLLVYTNTLTLLVALLGFFVYVFVYSIMKRVTYFATHIGAVAGAVPPVVGYASVTGVLDFYALLLFVILCTWQMSHFYAIALFRRFEYASASIPVLPLMKGIYRTKLEILFYTLAFSMAGLVLMIFSEAATFPRFILGVAAATWSGYAVHGFVATETTRWARTMFLLSLITLLAFCLAISIV